MSAGSGSYMYPSILAYDGITSVHTVWSISGFADSYYFFQANKLMIRGENKRFDLVYKNGFRLSKYRHRYGNPTLGVHVLRLDPTRRGMRFHFDDKVLPFQPDPSGQGLNGTVTCSMDSVLIIDDNFADEEWYVRNSDGEWRRGLPYRFLRSSVFPEER